MLRRCTSSGPSAMRRQRELIHRSASGVSGVSPMAPNTWQVFGAMGLTPDTPLADLWISSRCLRIADGPDEVHLRSIARLEIAEGQERRGSGSDYLTPPEVLRAR